LGFTSKDSILGGLRRRAEVRGSLGHQEQGKTRKRVKARTGVKAHGREPEHNARPASQQLGTAVPSGRRPELICSRFFSFGDLSIPQIFPCFSSAFGF